LYPPYGGFGGGLERVERVTLKTNFFRKKKKKKKSVFFTYRLLRVTLSTLSIKKTGVLRPKSL
jgi:hypothetical protein